MLASNMSALLLYVVLLLRCKCCNAAQDVSGWQKMIRSLDTGIAWFLSCQLVMASGPRILQACLEIQGEGYQMQTAYCCWAE